VKKKEKAKKKQTMPEFRFKEFTPEEDRIYSEAVEKFEEAVAAGKTLSQAYETYAIADEELRSLIQADFMKILIAERHFGQRQQLDQIASALGVSLDLLKNTLARMLQEVGVTAAAQAGQQLGDIAPKTDD
jgi:hypothetical protein